MIVSQVRLRNWRNFQTAVARLGQRMFLVGPNASGKSNFLDVFRFLRDIAMPGGGLQKAVGDRGGLSKIRCLAARRDPVVSIEVSFSESAGLEPIWKYEIGIRQEPRGKRQPRIEYERVWQGKKNLLQRPDRHDKEDPARLTQTHLEQINVNRDFRQIVEFLESTVYLHLVPQLLRYPDAFAGPGVPTDPFGRSFLERVVKTPEKTRRSRLRKIEAALQTAVPQLKQLTDTKDEMGIPHLEAVYEHWRPHAGKQREDQFSDGTLRLIGFLWSLLDGDSLLLLEEPELSLHSGVVRKLPALISKIQSRKKRQVMLSTHSVDLLSDAGIGGEEVLLLSPSTEGTRVENCSDIDGVRTLLESGLTIADAVVTRTEAKGVSQLSLFDAS